MTHTKDTTAPISEQTMESDGKLAPEALSVLSSKNLNRKAISIREIAQMDEPVLLSNDRLQEKKILHTDVGNRRLLNAFRSIRTKIFQQTSGKNATILLTSTGDEGGTSFVSLNLAAAFALDESKTSLLLDCNFNYANIDKILTGDSIKKPGLSDYLDNPDIDLQDIILPSGIPRLRIITAGSSVESYEHFTSPRLEEMFAELKNRYSERFIFLDSPPIAESADSRILMEYCDYVILVVSYGTATEDKILQAAKAINQDKFLGVVFNDEPDLF